MKFHDTSSYYEDKGDMIYFPATNRYAEKDPEQIDNPSKEGNVFSRYLLFIFFLGTILFIFALIK